MGEAGSSILRLRRKDCFRKRSKPVKKHQIGKTQARLLRERNQSILSVNLVIAREAATQPDCCALRLLEYCLPQISLCCLPPLFNQALLGYELVGRRYRPGAITHRSQDRVAAGDSWERPVCLNGASLDARRSIRLYRGSASAILSGKRRRSGARSAASVDRHPAIDSP